MKRLVIPAVIFCLIVPMLVLAYKVRVLNLSLIPRQYEDVWNFHVTIKPKGEQKTISFPIPKQSKSLDISDEKVKERGLETVLEHSHSSSVLTWISRDPIKKELSYSAKIDIAPIKDEKLRKDFTTQYTRSIRQYLKVQKLDEEELSAISVLEKAILEGNEDKTTKAKKIFYYVDEEIRRNYDYKTMLEALNYGKGSPLIKAKLFAVLARRQSIPTRIVMMIRLPAKNSPPKDKYNFTYANEVYLNNHWIHVDTNRGYFAKKPDRYLTIHRHYEEIADIISKKKISYKIKAERAILNRFNRKDYQKEILRQDSWVGKFSFYRLPLPKQNIFSAIILIPLGALVLCLARNFLGIPTFGIFTPILLTLFFKETTLAFGVGFFLLVVGLGFSERYILDKFYLLAIPRLSIILTLVIILLMIFSFTGLDSIMGASSHMAYFPIVIVTSFIERFSITLIEDGPVNTLKTLAGTLCISILSYFLYSITWLEVLFFTNPELLILLVGLFIMVGSYKGYRISEFIRFRDLVKQSKARS